MPISSLVYIRHVETTDIFFQMMCEVTNVMLFDVYLFKYVYTQHNAQKLYIPKGVFQWIFIPVFL